MRCVYLYQMRILMMSDVYFPRVNGVSTSILTYRDDLIELGHSCTLVAPRYPFPPELDDDDAIVRIPSWQLPFDPEDRALKWLRLREWSRSATKGEFDIVHVQTPFTAHYAGLSIARRLGIPIIETYHTYFEHYLHHYLPLAPLSLTSPVARRLTISQCHQVDAVISPSPQMADALMAYGVKTPIDILPTGLPASAFDPGDRASFRAAHGIEQNRPVALFVGRVAYEKNIEFLLTMLPFLKKRVPDILLVIAGQGPAQSHITRKAQSLGLQSSVQFVGNMDRANTLRHCYSAADVFIFASRTETQGLVLLESLAQGTPVVSTAVMGTADVLKDVKGGVVAPEEPDAFAAAAASVLTNREFRAALSAHARQDAERWSSAGMARRLVQLYEALITKASDRSGASK